MVNARMMYLRPGNLFKDFIIEECRQGVTGAGRPAVLYGGGGRMLKGCLAEASADEKESRSLPDHPVTHTVVQQGPPKAKRMDRLILGNRAFYIVDVDEAGSLGVATVYYAEERGDVE